MLDLADLGARSIHRMEEFIVKNGHPRPSYIQTREKPAHDDNRWNGIFQSEGAEHFY